MQLSPRILLAFLAAVLLFASDGAAVEEGETCEIDGFDFFVPVSNKTIVSQVAGPPGCSIGSKSDCFCGPDYETEGVAQWIWACDTQFGPIEGKVCPEAPPYEKGFLGENPTCDTSVNPTGERNDWSCGYSNCDEGGDESVICGCVDLALYGLGTGQKWYCIHSGCSCPLGDTSASPHIAATTAIVITFALAFVGLS